VADYVFLKFKCGCDECWCDGCKELMNVREKAQAHKDDEEL